MARKLVTLVVLVGVLLATVACASAPQTAKVTNVAEAPALPAVAQSEKTASGGSTALADDAARMIIRTASLNLVVTDAAPAQQAIVDLVNGVGGYVADSSAWREGEQLRARMTVRVPAGELDALLAAMKKLAVRVQEETVKGQDVTEEFTDLNAQLTNLEATEKELRELLAEVREKTQKAEDVLAVYRELTTIRGEIERVKGRMQYLDNLTAMATINVELIPDVLAKPVVEPGWRPLETLRNAGRALVNALKGLVNVLIYLVILVLPIALVIGAAVYLVVRVLRRLSRAASPRTRRSKRSGLSEQITTPRGAMTDKSPTLSWDELRVSGGGTEIG